MPQVEVERRKRQTDRSAGQPVDLRRIRPGAARAVIEDIAEDQVGISRSHLGRIDRDDRAVACGGEQGVRIIAVFHVLWPQRKSLEPTVGRA